MHPSASLSEWDTVVLMLPFLAVMALGMFRLDERIASSKPSQKVRRAFCGIEADGGFLLSDPDGRPCSSKPRTTREKAAVIAARIDSRPIRGCIQRRGVTLYSAK
jgi:hypothetical protein